MISKMQRIVLTAVVLFSMVAGYSGAQMQASNVAPLVYTAKLSTPDMLQTDPDGGLPGGGTQYCAPVSVTNSLVWLAEKGFARLLDEPGNSRSRFELAKILGSQGFMGTNVDYGTGPAGVLRGVDRYVRQCGYKGYLSYQGWRHCPWDYDTGAGRVELEWLKQGLQGNAAVWINIGWYEYEPDSDSYRRVGGHWVTMVGYGLDQWGRHSENTIVIHDPGSRRRSPAGHEYIELERIGSGKLTGDMYGLPASAADRYRFGGDFRLLRSIDAAIIDSAIVLKIR